MTSFPEKSRFDPPAVFAEREKIPQEKNDFATATLRQLEKDFALQGLQITLPEAVPPYGELLDMIADFLDREQIAGSKVLIRLLYQLDMDEAKMRALLAETPAENTLHALADQMVRRCLAKVITRAKFS
ncbi:MAG: hypothetical protein ABR572_10010 [Cryomorphaceae bacterium]|nr:hypothetical protein [Flavobacteriales bacterium]